MSAFRNITKADLLHGMANRKEHYDKKLKQANRELKREVTPSVKLSDIVNLDDIVKFITKED